LARAAEKLTHKEQEERDPFVDLMSPLAAGLERNWKILLGAGGAVLLVAFSVAIGFTVSAHRSDRAAQALGVALETARKPVEVPPAGTKPPAVKDEDSFPSETDKEQTLAKGLEEVLSRYPGTVAARTATLGLGDARYRLGKFAEAGESYGQYLKLAPPEDTLRALAWIGKAYAELGQHKGDEALAATRHLRPRRASAATSGSGRRARSPRSWGGSPMRGRLSNSSKPNSPTRASARKPSSGSPPLEMLRSLPLRSSLLRLLIRPLRRAPAMARPDLRASSGGGWLLLGILALIGCGAPPAGVSLLSRYPALRPDGTAFKVEWRTFVDSDLNAVAPVGLEMLRWSSEESSGPTFVTEPDEEIVVGSSDGVVTAFSTQGKALWKFRTGGAITSRLTNQDGRVYVGSSDGLLYALDAADGTQIWVYDTGEELGSAPIPSGDAILVASRHDTVFCVEAATGHWRWHYRRTNNRQFTIRGVAAPRPVGELVIAGFSDGTIVALQRKDGTVKWQHTLPVGEQFADADGDPQTASLESGRVYVASYTGGVAALSLDSGSLIWRQPLPEATCLLLHGNQVFAGAVGRLISVAASDGHLLWDRTTGDVSAHHLQVVNGMLLVPTAGPLLFLDPRTGKAFGHSFNPGRGITGAPVASGRYLYALSNAGWLYGLKLQ
jgi:outer membrane protein assembly factor BamB